MADIAATRKRMMESLIECAGDKADALGDQISHSIGSIAAEDPALVADQLHLYLKDGKKLSGSHRIAVLKITKIIVSDYGARIPHPLLGNLAKLAADDFGTPGDVDEPLHSAAAAVLVACSEFVPDIALASLQAQIPSGSLPPLFTLKALADIAKAHPAAFVSRMRPILAALLPLVGLIRYDNMRWAFSAAFGHLGCALIRVREPTLLGDVGATAPSVPPGAAECGDSMLTAATSLLEWVSAKEAPVRLAACEALGYVSASVSTEQLHGVEGIYRRAMGAVLGMLKKERARDAIPALVGLHALLCVGAERCRIEVGEMLEPVFSLLVAHLQQLTSASSGASELDPETVRAHSEVLRCFEPLARAQCDALLGLVQRPLDPRSVAKDATTRACALVVLRHMAMRNDAQLAPLRDTVISVGRLALNDTDWRVRRALVQLVLSLGQCGVSYLSCEGANDLVSFVFAMAATPSSVVSEFADAHAKTKDIASVPGEVKRIACSVVQLFVQAPELDAVMWPAVLELMLESRKNDTYIGAGALLLYALSVIGGRLHAAGSTLYYVNFGRFPNMAPPTALVPRVLVYLSCYQSKAFAGARDVRVAATRVVQALGPLMDYPRPADGSLGPVGKLWSQHGPALSQYADDTAAFNASEWEDVLHKLLSKTIQTRESESDDWTTRIVEGFSEDIGGYGRAPGADTIARVALSMTGAAAARCQRKDIVAKALECMLSSTNHASAEQRKGCARGLGYLAQAYTDLVLERLGQLAKGGEVKKSFFGKSKEKPAAPDEMRATVAAGLGYVASKTPLQLITSRMDQYILPQLLMLLGDIGTKTTEGRDAVLEGLTMVGVAMRKQPDFSMRSKDTVITALLGTATSSPSAMPGALGAIASFIALPTPPLAQSVYADVVKLLSKATGGHAVHASRNPKEKDRKDEDPKASTPLAADASPDELGQAVTGVVVALLQSSQWVPSETVAAIARHVVGPASVSEKAEERHRALCVLEAMARDVPQGASDFDVSLGCASARALPRLADASIAVREASVRALGVAVSRLAQPSADVDSAVRQLSSLQGTLSSVPYANVARGVATLFATTLRDGALVAALHCALRGDDDSLPGAQLMPPTEPTAAKAPKGKEKQHAAPESAATTPPAIDAQPDCAAAVAVFLNGLLKHAGGALSSGDVRSVFESLFTLLDPLVGTPQDVLANGLLHATKTLARHHNSVAFDVIFERPIPHTTQTDEAIAVWAADATLAPAFVRQCMDVLVNFQLYDDATKSDRQRRDARRGPGGHSSAAAAAFGDGGFVVAPAHLAAASVLATVATVDAGRVSVMDVIPDVFCALTFVVSAAHEAASSRKSASDEAVTISTRALSKLLKAVLKPTTFAAIEPTLAHTASSHTAGPAFAVLLDALVADEADAPYSPAARDARTAATPATARLRALYEFVEPYAHKDYDGLRLCACSLLGEMLWHVGGDDAILAPAVNALLARSGPDEADIVKSAAIAALTGLVGHSSSASTAVIPTVVATLLASFNDSSPAVPLLAVSAVTKLVNEVCNPASIDPSLVTILQRARPLLTSRQPEMRAATFALLSGCFNGAAKGRLSAAPVDQVFHTLLPVMLLHIEDEDQRVRLVPQFAGCVISPFIVVSDYTIHSLITSDEK